MLEKILVSISGGLGSAYTLKLAIEEYGKENVIAVFADVKGSGLTHFWQAQHKHAAYLLPIEELLHERFGGETRDTYRFIWELSHALDIPIERLEDGRSIWAIFGQTRSFRLLIPNNKGTLCKASEILKREMIATHLERLRISHVKMALGMGKMEGHRIVKAQSWWNERLPNRVEVFSPMIEAWDKHRFYYDNCVALDWLKELGITPPQAYEDGYSHNNCNQICVMAGQSQWAKLYREHQEEYLYAAHQENAIRQMLGVEATILSITRNGEKRPISLLEFIPYIERGEVNEMDLGGSCSCFTQPSLFDLAKV